MLTRRHLFRALSAIAVAPLAKWLPKEPVASFDGGLPDECVTYTRSPLFICTHDGMWIINDDFTTYRRVPTARVTVCEPFTVSGQLPVPQEEA